jgi:drug/metabolite transporter (DMT)-like permease
LAAALLFGASTPLAKRLLDGIGPWLLAALLYLGSGAGLWLLRRVRQAAPVRPSRAEWGWLAAATVVGGVVAPVLLMTGLQSLPAAAAALMLNAESVLTALLAWLVFRENVDRRIAFGMACIVAGALVLSWPGTVPQVAPGPALAVLGACLAWAIDNNLTRKVALTDASFIAMVKGLVAGTVNLGLALALGASAPAPASAAAAGLLGFVSYGASLVLYVIALRHLGSARTGAYFSVAPFFGALLAVPLLGESLGPQGWLAGALMAVGVWLHLAERHEHEHDHDALQHEHAHTHDEHHCHAHEAAVAAGVTHTHWHRHEPMTHRHRHHPDAHHDHRH